MAITVQDKRINAAERPVYDVYRDGRFMATVEVLQEPAGNGVRLKVLLGAMQPRGKELALEAILEYNRVSKDTRDEMAIEGDR